MEKKLKLDLKSIEADVSISDGYHTFDELYDHRIALFMALCRYFIQGKASYDERMVWMSKLHSDRSHFDGWFILGIGKEKGNQITYHLPDKYWNECTKFAAELPKAPEWEMMEIYRQRLRL